MAKVVINLGDTPIELTGSADLSKFAQGAPDIVFQIAQSDLVKFHDRPLSEVPSDSNKPVSASLKVTQDAKWKVGGSGELTIGFSASATGTVKIVRSGDLFQYAVDDDRKHDIKVSVPEGFAYIVVNFRVSLGLKAGAAFSHGNLGVKGGIDSSVLFNLTNYKCFPVSTRVDEAVKDAFERFALPFKAEDLTTSVSSRDYLEYEFIGRLGLTFGVTYGLTGLILGGRSLGEIEKSFESEAGKLIVAVKPSLEAGAKFGINYQYTDAFRIVVGRRTGTQNNSDKLTLFLSRMDIKNLGISVGVGLTVGLGASFNLASNLDEIIDKAAKSLFKDLPEGLVKDAAIAAFKENLKKQEHKRELEKYIKEANEQVNNLLKKVDNQKLELQLLHERLDTKTSIFNYEFDLNEPAALEQGFRLAMEGNFQEALQVRGVSLGSGSYIENEFIRRTTISFQFFDLFMIVSITEYFKKVSIVYAGGGVFKLRFTSGIKHDDGFVGHLRHAEVYFTADVTTKDFQTVSDLDVKLHFVIIDHANRRAARKTLSVLQLIGGSVQLQQLTARLRTVLENDASLDVKVSCAFDKKAYGKLTSDDFGPDNKPHQLPQPYDQANWEAFVRAVDNILVGDGYKGEGFPNYVSGFNDWVLYNRVANDQDGSTITPNRKNRGNANTMSVWPEGWRSRDSHSDRQFLRIYLDAGRGFMNFADGLKHLAQDVDTVKTEEQYQELLATLNYMIKDGNDAQAWFAKPILLALLRLTGGRIINIKGPAENEEIGKLFELSFDVSG